MPDTWEINNALDKFARAANEMSKLDKKQNELHKRLGVVNDRRDALRRIKDEARKTLMDLMNESPVG